jgi:hypothetical protein
VILKPVLQFAKGHKTDWAISELGYLEDINNSTHKALALAAAVAYAEAGRISSTVVYRPALWISYWDSSGTRGDWQLRWNSPPAPSASATSNAALAWRNLAAAP